MQVYQLQTENDEEETWRDLVRSVIVWRERDLTIHFNFFFTFLSARSPRMDSIGHYGLLLLGEKIWMWTKGSHLRELRVPCNSVRGLLSFFFFFLFFSLFRWPQNGASANFVL